MGVDTWYYAPPHVRLDDFADVAGILLGCPHELRSLHSLAGSHYAEVEGASTRVSPSQPNCAWVEVDSPTRGEWAGLWQFEASGANSGHRSFGEHCIGLRARALNIATFVGAARTFGGLVTVDERKTIELVPIVRSRWPHNWSPGDGDEWEEFQRMLDATVPLTEADIAAQDEHAVYPR
jgi:hypothetical protein